MVEATCDSAFLAVTGPAWRADPYELAPDALITGPDPLGGVESAEVLGEGVRAGAPRGCSLPAWRSIMDTGVETSPRP